MPKMKAPEWAGKRFGRLLVVSTYSAGRWPSLDRCKCLCDCGKKHDASKATLRGGYAKSCGCLRREVTSKRFHKHGHTPWHGKTSGEYYVWAAMIQRCTNPKNKSFKWYGARGIKVCKRWRDFRNFIKDMGARPAGLTIERKNGNMGYCPSNCVWATLGEQRNNMRTNRYVEHNGKRMTIAQWERELGFKESQIYQRMYNGLSFEAAIAKSFKRRKKPTRKH